MRSSILVLAFIAAVLSSCTTAYKTGQTPDDVYYSPTRPQDEYVRVENKQERNYYEGSEDYYTDRYLRMRVVNRYQWSALDDYYNNPYLYSPYSYYSNWNNPWNSYWAWNSYCNPYYGGGAVIIKNPVAYKPPSRAVVFNPNSYINNPPAQTANVKGINNPGTRSSSYSNGYNSGGSSTRYNNSNSNGSSYSNSGSTRSSSSSSSSNSGSSSSTPTRSYTPSSSSSSSSSSGSSSSSSGSSSRPPR